MALNVTADMLSLKAPKAWLWWWFLVSATLSTAPRILYSIKAQTAAMYSLTSDATLHCVGLNMRRQTPQQSYEAKREENPFKRRGPGAAYAAPLAFSSADKNTIPVAHALDYGIDGKEMEQRQPCKRSRTADGAGTSTAAMASADNMQLDVFPRCRISSVNDANNTSGIVGSDSHDAQYLDSSKQSRPEFATHHEACRASFMQPRPERVSSTIKKRTSIRVAENDVVPGIPTTHATVGTDESPHGFPSGVHFCGTFIHDPLHSHRSSAIH